MNEDNQRHEEIQSEESSVIQGAEIQTDRKLSNNSPRKKILKKKIHRLQKKLRKLKDQLKQRKANCTKTSKKLSLLEYCVATDQILPPSIASFVKAHLTQKSPNGRKYE